MPDHGRPDLSDTETAALAAVAKGYGLLRRAADRNLAAHSGLTRAQYEILTNLSASPDGLRMFELADAVVLSRSTLTYHVTQLEELGLATREGGSKNQRAVSARITDAGTNLIEHLRSTHIDLLRTHFFASFTPEELAVVTAGFTRVEESFAADAATTEADGPG